MIALDAARLVAGYADGSLSPVEVLSAVLDRLAAVDGRINAFRETDAEAALLAARQAERRWRDRAPLGPLDGVPVSVKDLTPVAGMATLFGSRSVDPKALSGVDAPAVARLREAGAVLFGKTTTSEFGFKIVTECSLTGSTRNPWRLSHHAGGSSGGAGAAVAAGIGPLALASDGGGSIRIPAAWCGVVGFKPSYKRVPTAGGEGAGSLATLGPIARTVADAARMLTVIAQGCREDWQGMESCGTDFAAGLAEGVRGLRIAFSRDLGIVDLAPGIAAPVEAAVRILADLGAEVEEIEVPAMADYLEQGIHGTQWLVRMARLVAELPPERRELLDPDYRALAAIGAGIPTQALVAAQAGRERLGAEMHRLLLRYDLLATSTFHVPAPPAPGLPESLAGPPPLTSWCNQTMQPALSLPCGFTGEGLPVGLQLVARRYADTLVLRAGAAYEAARGAFPMPPLTR